MRRGLLERRIGYGVAEGSMESAMEYLEKGLDGLLWGC